MTETPAVVLDTPMVRVATWRELFIALWLTPGTPAAVKAHNEAQWALAQKIGRNEKMITLTVVEARSLVSVNTEVRRLVEQHTGEIKPRLKAAAAVITAKGFGAAALRSVISALSMLHRPAYPTRVFDTNSAACDWLAGFFSMDRGRPVAAAEVLGVVQAVSAKTASTSEGKGKLDER